MADVQIEMSSEGRLWIDPWLTKTIGEKNLKNLYYKLNVIW
jgi:hypothetical protein